MVFLERKIVKIILLFQTFISQSIYFGSSVVNFGGSFQNKIYNYYTLLLTLDSSESSRLTFWRSTLPIWTCRFCCSSCANCGFCDRIAGFCCSSCASAGFWTNIWFKGELVMACKPWCCCCCCCCSCDWCCCGCCCCCCCCCKFGEFAFDVWQDCERLPRVGIARCGLCGVCGGVGGLPGAIDEASFSSFTFTFPAKEDYRYYLFSRKYFKNYDSRFLNLKI